MDFYAILAEARNKLEAKDKMKKSILGQLIQIAFKNEENPDHLPLSFILYQPFKNYDVKSLQNFLKELGLNVQGIVWVADETFFSLFKVTLKSSE